jgi:hypothetical protein
VAHEDLDLFEAEGGRVELLKLGRGVGGPRLEGHGGGGCEGMNWWETLKKSRGVFIERYNGVVAQLRW